MLNQIMIKISFRNCNISLKAVIIQGSRNNAVDTLSPIHWSRFRKEIPDGEYTPCPIPNHSYPDLDSGEDDLLKYRQ